MSNSVRNAWVVTHVQPTGNDVGVVDVSSPPWSLGQTVSLKLGRFREGHPKALGTVQIMIGVMILLIGILMASSIRQDNIGVYSGIFVWGSLIYVIAGSLTVAADNQLNKCRVKGSLGMNVVAAITSFMGIILFSLDTAGILQYYCVYFDCHMYWNSSQELSAVLVILSLLEFIVSICVSSFACKAVCQCCQCCHTPTVSAV
ncbi:membrane-spanning 4-domains subfamily A member 4A-like [Esox lucius]|uniref:membrane-spanning 4-domains subfamily A member 4A-like n=1 Tax=Esox lucius TaxID=8010 RepID=UPI000661B92E|nr:membrane-spanning 4-domains subfamily A member 4A-like [Esox lucius]